MAPNRPHLHAVDSEPAEGPVPGRPRRPWRALPWLALALVALAVSGWWLFALESAELRRSQAELARSRSRVFSLESRMRQVGRSASALAATLSAAEEQARAIEALARPEQVAPAGGEAAAKPPAEGERSDGDR